MTEKDRYLGDRLVFAAMHGDISLASALLSDGAPVNERNAVGWTGLHWAACLVSHEMAELLLGRGAKVDIRDASGATALHWAASSGNPETIRLLVSAGSDMSAVNGGGYTPLEIAVSKWHIEAAAALIEMGADPGSIRESYPSEWAAVCSCVDRSLCKSSAASVAERSSDDGLGL